MIATFVLSQTQSGNLKGFRFASYLVCSHRCLSHTSGQSNPAGTCTGNLPWCWGKGRHCGMGSSHIRWYRSHMFDLKGKTKKKSIVLLGNYILTDYTHIQPNNQKKRKTLAGKMYTLPSFRADAGEALIIFRLLTYSTIFTWPGTAGGQ